MAIIAVSCQKEVSHIELPRENETEDVTSTRSYNEALQIAEDALNLLEYKDTRSSKNRVIKRDEG